MTGGQLPRPLHTPFFVQAYQASKQSDFVTPFIASFFDGHKFAALDEK
jgi:hypothetical protein